MRNTEFSTFDTKAGVHIVHSHSLNPAIIITFKTPERSYLRLFTPFWVHFSYYLLFYGNYSKVTDPNPLFKCHFGRRDILVGGTFWQGGHFGRGDLLTGGILAGGYFGRGDTLAGGTFWQGGHFVRISFFC